MKIVKAGCAMLLCGATVYGCSAGGGNSGPSGSVTYTVPTLSPTCQSFNQAFCAYDAKCFPQDTGCTQQEFFCTNDTAAQTCTAALSSATCTGSIPTQCQGTLNAQPAIDFCNALAQSFCNIELKCGDAGLTMQACESQVEGAQVLNCSSAIAVSKTANQCLSDLSGAGCSALKTAPSSCKQVVATTGGADAGPAVPTVWLNGIPLSGLRQVRKIVSRSPY